MIRLFLGALLVMAACSNATAPQQTSPPPLVFCDSVPAGTTPCVWFDPPPPPHNPVP